MSYIENEVHVPGNGFPEEVDKIKVWVLENNLRTVSNRGSSSRYDSLTFQWYDYMVWNIDDETERLLFVLRWGA